MKTWRFYAFGDMRLDDIELAAYPPDHVLVEPLVVQPSATEAQLAPYTQAQLAETAQMLSG